MNNLKQLAEDGSTLAKETYEESSNKMKNELGSIKEKVSSAADKCCGYVKENPWKSISFSILAGVLGTQLFRLMKFKKH